MTQDEIIRMAREAGFGWHTPSEQVIVRHSNGSWIGIEEQLERFAALVAAHEAEKWKAANKRDYENWKMTAEKAAECEREACAKVCNELKKDYEEAGLAQRINNEDQQKALSICTAAIRARGEK